jgi:hypothetical protein
MNKGIGWSNINHVHIKPAPRHDEIISISSSNPSRVTHLLMTPLLAEIPIDIFVVLATHLYNDHFSTFISLRSACSIFIRNLKGLFFRHITIKGEHVVEKEILKRMKEPDGDVAGMVHCIRFAPSTRKPFVAENLISAMSECWKYFVSVRKIL